MKGREYVEGNLYCIVMYRIVLDSRMINIKRDWVDRLLGIGSERTQIMELWLRDSFGACEDYLRALSQRLLTWRPEIHWSRRTFSGILVVRMRRSCILLRRCVAPSSADHFHEIQSHEALEILNSSSSNWTIHCGWFIAPSLERHLLR